MRWHNAIVMMVGGVNVKCCSMPKRRSPILSFTEETNRAPLVCYLLMSMSLTERNYWSLLSKKTIVTDGCMHCGHASRCRMLKENACIVGEDVAML